MINFIRRAWLRFRLRDARGMLDHIEREIQHCYQISYPRRDSYRKHIEAIEAQLVSLRPKGTKHELLWPEDSIPRQGLLGPRTAAKRASS